MEVLLGRNKELMGALENNIQKDSGIGVMGSCSQWEEGGVMGCILEESREGVMDSERGMERFGHLCRISVVVSHLLFAVCSNWWTAETMMKGIL